MYFKQIKDSLSHYQKLQGDLESDLRDIFEKKKYLNNELQVNLLCLTEFNVSFSTRN